MVVSIVRSKGDGRDRRIGCVVVAVSRSGLLGLEVVADMVVWARAVDSKPSITSKSEPRGDMTLGIVLSQLRLELPGSILVGRVKVTSLPIWRRGGGFTIDGAVMCPVSGFVDAKKAAAVRLRLVCVAAATGGIRARELLDRRRRPR